jgi:hypothetical protein
MEKQLFSDTQIATLRKGYNKIKTVDPESFNERIDKVFKTCTSDQVCQLARAGIKFVSTAAYFEAKKRGITIEGWRLSHDENG